MANIVRSDPPRRGMGDRGGNRKQMAGAVGQSTVRGSGYGGNAGQGATKPLQNSTSVIRRRSGTAGGRTSTTTNADEVVVKTGSNIRRR